MTDVRGFPALFHGISAIAWLEAVTIPALLLLCAGFTLSSEIEATPDGPDPKAQEYHYCCLEFEGLVDDGGPFRIELGRKGRAVVTHGLVPTTVEGRGVTWTKQGQAGTLCIAGVKTAPSVVGKLTITSTVAGTRIGGTYAGTYAGKQVAGRLTGALLRRLLYVCLLDSSESTGGGSTVAVLDIDDDHRCIKEITSPAMKTCKRGRSSVGGLRGVGANPTTDRFYYVLWHGNPKALFGPDWTSTLGNIGQKSKSGKGGFYVLGCIDLRTDAVVWEVETPGLGEPGITWDGSRIFVGPQGMGTYNKESGCWWVLDGETGKVIKTLKSGGMYKIWTGDDGRYVYAPTWTRSKLFGPGLIRCNVETYECEAVQGFDVKKPVGASTAGLGRLFGIGFFMHFRNRYSYDAALTKSRGAKLFHPIPGAPEGQVFELGVTHHAGIQRLDWRTGAITLIPFDPRLLPAEWRTDKQAALKGLGAAYPPHETLDATRLYYSSGYDAGVHVYDNTVEPPRHIAHWGHGTGRGNKSGVWNSHLGDIVWTADYNHFDARTGKHLGPWRNLKGKPIRSTKFIEIHFEGDTLFGTASATAAVGSTRAT